MKRVRLLALSAAFAATMAVASASGGGTGENASDLVRDAMSAQTKVSYTGDVEVKRVGKEGSDLFVYRVEHQAPDASVRTYRAPQSLSGDEIITRGRVSYSVDEQRKRVVVSDNDAATDRLAFADNYALMQKNYRAVKRADSNFDRRDVFVVALINNYTKRTTMVVVIDKATKLALDKAKFASDGSLTSEYRLEDVAFVTAIPVADFAIPGGLRRVQGPDFGDPSEDVARVVASAGFAALGPKFLPEGFSPVEGKLVSIEGVRTLHLLYSDGIRTVSLFENVNGDGVDMQRWHPEATTIDGRPAQYAESGHTTLLAWPEGSLHCALVGELDLGELQHIAASI